MVWKKDMFLDNFVFISFVVVLWIYIDVLYDGKDLIVFVKNRNENDYKFVFYIVVDNCKLKFLWSVLLYFV